MTDIELFRKHFTGFTFTDEDVSEKVEVGQSSGLSKAKGYTADTEILTSLGWMLFPQVKEILENEMSMFTTYNDYVQTRNELNKTNPKGLNDGGYVNTLRYNYAPLLIASITPYSYDEQVKSRVGDAGRVIFTQPTGFHQWFYTRNIVRIKMRGIDVRMTPYAEIVAKKKYRNGYTFVKTNDMYENQYEEYFYLGLNKFSRSISENFTPNKAHIMSQEAMVWWENVLRHELVNSDGRTTVERKQIFDAYVNRSGVENTNAFRANTGHIPGLDNIIQSYTPNSLIPTEINVEGRGAEIVSNEYATRYTGYRDYVYNITLPPHKNLIIRKFKAEESERKWIGKPLVVGDNSNKHIPENGSYITRKTMKG